jgi:hypothetical protein
MYDLENIRERMPGTPITTKEKPMTIDKAIPVVVTTEEGGEWKKPFAVKYADGTVYDPVSGWHKQMEVVRDPVAGWEKACANDPLASSMIARAGDDLAREVKRLRDQIKELEKQLRPDDLDF